MPISRLPLRISLPAAVIALGISLAALFMFWSHRDAEQRLHEEISLLLLEKAQDIATDVEINSSDPAVTQRAFAARTQQARIRAAAVVDASGKVVQARAPGWQGREITDVASGFNREQAQQALHSGVPLFSGNTAGNTYSLYLALPTAAAQAGSGLQSAVLWLVYDVGDINRKIRVDTKQRAAALIFTLLSMGAILWWLLHRQIGLRLKQLAQAANELALGNLQRRIDIEGDDEIARLGRNLNQLAESLDQAEQQRQQQQIALTLSEQYYRSLFESSLDFIAIFDLELRHVDGNPAYLKMLGYTQEEILKLSYDDVAEDSGDQEERQRLAEQIFQRGYSDEYEKAFIRKDGRRCQVSVKAVLMRDAAGKPYRVWGIGRDIGARKQAEAALKLASKVYAASHEGIIVTDPERIILSANPAYSDITGYPPAEAVGHKPRFLLSDHYDDRFYIDLLTTVTHDGFWQGEIVGRRKNGELYPVWLTITAAFEEGRLVNYIITFSDITDRKQAENHIRHLAEHDFLTDLPNRVLLLDRLSQTLAQARRNGGNFALMFVDLDRFKQINDTLGHHVGDLLLQEVARRLQQSLRDSDTVSRQGGDEFVMLLPEAGDVDELNQLANRLMQAITQPYRLESHEFTITASIGIALYPGDGEDIDTLVRNADTAMYHAKQHGRNQCRFFTAAMNAKLSERLLLENRLRKAIAQGQMQLHYQPKIDIASQRIVGAEALLRWHDPEEGSIPPSRFIPVAEESGLITELGEWVLRTACRQAREWQERGLGELVMSVNVSAVQFRQPNLAQVVAHALEAAELPGRYLELELTEGMLMEQPAAANQTMEQLKAMGVGLSLDDFGTGYSSLSYLKRFPFDTLKIDQSFIRDLCQDGEDDSLVKTIILMAKNLNLRAVAEGVETQQQLDFLAENECDEFQGFFRSRAVSANEFEQLIRAA